MRPIYGLGMSAGAFTAAAMNATGAATISVAGFPPWVVTLGFLVVSFAGLMDWRRSTGGADGCDAPHCNGPATVSVSDETAFCASCAAEFYAVAEGDR